MIFLSTSLSVRMIYCRNICLLAILCVLMPSCRTSKAVTQQNLTSIADDEISISLWPTPLPMSAQCPAYILDDTITPVSLFPIGSHTPGSLVKSSQKNDGGLIIHIHRKNLTTARSSPEISTTENGQNKRILALQSSIIVIIIVFVFVTFIRFAFRFKVKWFRS